MLWIVREHERRSDKLGPPRPDGWGDREPPGVREPPPRTAATGRVHDQRLPRRHLHLCENLCTLCCAYPNDIHS